MPHAASANSSGIDWVGHGHADSDAGAQSASPAFLRDQLGLSVNDLRFPDMWTVAASAWPAKAESIGINVGPDHVYPWNGHWLRWSRPDEVLSDADECPQDVLANIQAARQPGKCGPPPIYYAILKLDGDDLA